ncbi:nicotinate-nucleotide pyrophosphorylase [Platysternon megacephalum]|uniref:Nicotinate-nucleotide pyrophosphorylase n=1 Tax=Platysternon megacephalum TaxID=55544 RepID=A0A4D9DMQ9_9SAUR|nr:nicotinate-nucleotide pyrophosphorylase [Platysternon megacephalum]
MPQQPRGGAGQQAVPAHLHQSHHRNGGEPGQSHQIHPRNRSLSGALSSGWQEGEGTEGGTPARAGRDTPCPPAPGPGAAHRGGHRLLSFRHWRLSHWGALAHSLQDSSQGPPCPCSWGYAGTGPTVTTYRCPALRLPGSAAHWTLLSTAREATRGRASPPGPKGPIPVTGGQRAAGFAQAGRGPGAGRVASGLRCRLRLVFALSGYKCDRGGRAGAARVLLLAASLLPGAGTQAAFRSRPLILRRQPGEGYSDGLRSHLCLLGHRTDLSSHLSPASGLGGAAHSSPLPLPQPSPPGKCSCREPDAEKPQGNPGSGWQEGPTKGGQLSPPAGCWLCRMVAAGPSSTFQARGNGARWQLGG